MILPIDHTKVGISDFAHVCDIADLDMIVTDEVTERLEKLCRAFQGSSGVALNECPGKLEGLLRESFTLQCGVFDSIPGSFLRRRFAIRSVFRSCGDSSWTRMPSTIRIREEGDPVCYENFAFNDNVAEGDIFFGTTVIYPGKVGLEYHLTRGHYHRKRQHAETYQALSGRGLVLFEREDGSDTHRRARAGQGHLHPAVLGAPLGQYR